MRSRMAGSLLSASVRTPPLACALGIFLWNDIQRLIGRLTGRMTGLLSLLNSAPLLRNVSIQNIFTPLFSFDFSKKLSKVD